MLQSNDIKTDIPGTQYRSIFFLLCIKIKRLSVLLEQPKHYIHVCEVNDIVPSDTSVCSSYFVYSGNLHIYSYILTGVAP